MIYKFNDKRWQD